MSNILTYNTVYKGAKKAANKAKAAKAARTIDKKRRNVRELSSMESGQQEQERSTRLSGKHNEISLTLDEPSDFESCRNKMLVDSDELTHPPSSSSSRTQSVSSYAAVMGDDDIAVVADKTEFNILSGDNTDTEIFVVNMDQDGFTKALGKRRQQGWKKDHKEKDQEPKEPQKRQQRSGDAISPVDAAQ